MHFNVVFRTLFFSLTFPALCGMAFAQTDDVPVIPRDTSFNVNSTYLKEKKKFPFIKIVEPDLPQNVAADENVVYRILGNTPWGERRLHADVFFPKDTSSGPYPGVILVHGGGWRSGTRSHLLPLAQQLASRGYVAVTVEYRLSVEAMYPAAVDDVRDAIKWLRKNGSTYPLDTGKIAVLGTSAGAQLASLVGVTSGLAPFEANSQYTGSSAVQAVVNIDGIVSFVHPEAASEGKSASLWLGGSREERPDRWKEASALEYVDKNTPPFLFINSSLPRFHAGRDDMIKKLDALNIFSEVHTLPDTPHPFWLFHPWFSPTFSYTVNFLDKVFK